MVKLALLVAVVAGCSYGASFDDCRVSHCEGPEDCPGGFTCDGEGFCRAPGATIACASVIDGGTDIDAKSGGDGSLRCTGTATTCATYSAMPACTAQTGCGWTQTSCTVTTNCAMYTTNSACSNAPECMTDFTTSTCVRDPSYCQGNSEAQCEAVAKCAWGGGCIGTANTCGEFTSASGCNAQSGCGWH